MKKCGNCGNDYRSGGLAYVLRKGGLRLARVCGSCVKAGAVVVAPLVATPDKPKAAPRDASWDRVLRQLRTYARVARSVDHAVEDPAYQSGRGRGLRGSH